MIYFVVNCGKQAYDKEDKMSEIKIEFAEKDDAGEIAEISHQVAEMHD